MDIDWVEWWRGEEDHQAHHGTPLILPSPNLTTPNSFHGIQYRTPMCDFRSPDPARTRHLNRTTGPRGVAHRQWTPTSLGRKEEVWPPDLCCTCDEVH